MTTHPARWYCVNNIGMATLCADEADAEKNAKECDLMFPSQAPFRAVQLVEAADHNELQRLRTENAIQAKLIEKTLHVAPNYAKLLTAVERMHAAKGRYHTQIAAAELYELCGLPAERPKK